MTRVDIAIHPRFAAALVLPVDNHLGTGIEKLGHLNAEFRKNTLEVT
jgi:hypothetical protein